MKILTPTEKQDIEARFEEILENCHLCQKEEDTELVKKAFKIANEAHKDMRRKSGEPYIYHPLAVSMIVTKEIGLGPKSVACAFLHDIVEDTDYTVEDIEYHFGKKIASIIDGLTKISGVFDRKSTLQAENFRRLLLTMSDDVRVILIKLADRLHNMRTLDSLPAHKQYKIAGETLYLYAPLAHRLGLNLIKRELEDLSLKYQHPAIYEQISNKLKETEADRVRMINEFAMPISDVLHKNDFEFQLGGRVKSIYSIWNKMQSKEISFDDIYDLMAIRIVFKPKEGMTEKSQCWIIYSLITNIYTPKPERIRDWVSQPKANGYEALHVTVMGINGRWIEVQIRSERMNEIAERGFAAHWRYKDDQTQGSSELDKWLMTIREHLQNPNSDALEFLDEFKMNLFTQEIMVFTPKGQIKTLPKDATALDFAYEIHSEIGNKAIGAKANHKLVPLNYRLSSGDQVEIITSEHQKSQIKWLNYVKTAKAKASITNSLKSERKNRISRGQKLLEEKLKELDLYPNASIFRKLFDAYNVVSKDELYSKIGSDIIQLDDLKKILKKQTPNKWIKYWQIQFNKATTRIQGDNLKQRKKKKNNQQHPLILSENIDEQDPIYRIAPCCNPIPGDDVIGFRNENEEIVIHKAKCNEALKLMSSHGDSIIPAKWTSHKILSFLVRLRVKGLDRKALAYDLTAVISKELNVSMRSINIETNNGIFEGNIDLYVHNAEDLNSLISRIKKIKGMDRVIREDKID